MHIPSSSLANAHPLLCKEQQFLEDYIQTDLLESVNAYHRLDSIMDEDNTTVRNWKFDDVDLILRDDILMEAIDDSEHSQSDTGPPVPIESEWPNEDSGNCSIIENVPDENFQLMQEPIVEDPRHEYCELMSLHEQNFPSAPSKRTPVRRNVHRHVSWTATERDLPESVALRYPPAVSTDKFQEALHHFAESLRQSETTRSYLRHQMQLSSDKTNMLNPTVGPIIRPSTTTCSFSVDETRRSLITLFEEQQRTWYVAKTKPVIRRCKSSDAA
ncbi:hypothetical protein IV203_023620 [Nitzschia inconspicua]|uniref:Uncharacterized protein n=1 Tax=Nitzschia inconspicua TaxID=303405 RepID=A0A9K3PBM6_9STRA|nr:hypothetical protein IV203_023620 [Nitzschia inconspicua]